MDRYLLIDGYSVLCRMHMAMPRLSYENQNTGALKGFTNKLLEWLCPEDGQPGFTHVGLFLDRRDSQGMYRRNRIEPSYKSGRKKRRDESQGWDELMAQIPLVRDLCAALGIPVFEVAGEEADDLIAGAAIMAADAAPGDSWVEVVSTDKDLLGLIAHGVAVLDLKDSQYWNHQAFLNKWGFAPSLMSLYLCLVGDSADSYGGVRGVGPEAAKEILRYASSIDEVWASRHYYTKRVSTAVCKAGYGALAKSWLLARLYTEAWTGYRSDLQRKPSQSSQLRAFFDR